MIGNSEIRRGERLAAGNKESYARASLAVGRLGGKGYPEASPQKGPYHGSLFLMESTRLPNTSTGTGIIEANAGRGAC